MVLKRIHGPANMGKFVTILVQVRFRFEQVCPWFRGSKKDPNREPDCCWTFSNQTLSGPNPGPVQVRTRSSGFANRTPATLVRCQKDNRSTIFGMIQIRSNDICTQHKTKQKNEKAVQSQAKSHQTLYSFDIHLPPFASGVKKLNPSGLIKLHQPEHMSRRQA